ncbi:MAG: MerR family transcriptional regulator [Bacteroidetes bacterium]|nr:MerR family transcriptional regulator [Bacteroidota bacterium]MCL5026785.1 MerR family transcriptional regulator [Chloroflexota bacterium]
MAGLLRIGDVVERTGLTHRALHYYEEIGLLVPSVKLDGGMRLYTEEDLRRIDRILELRELLGLSLKEIKRILEAEEARASLLLAARREPTPESRRADLEKALAIAEDQLALIRARLKEMRALEGRLADEAQGLRDALKAS